MSDRTEVIRSRTRQSSGMSQFPEAQTRGASPTHAGTAMFPTRSPELRRVRLRCVLGLLFVWLCTPLVLAAAEPLPLPRMGMNLSGIVDWTREWPLVDVFKPSRSWREIGPGPFEYDTHGYPRLKPGQSVETLMCREVEGHYPAGVYVCTYEGRGQVEIRRWDVKRVVSESPGRIEFEVAPNHGGILLEIKASDPQDPVRNIHVWMPGFADGRTTFHPLFLERLKPFGVLRFMDWQHTNNNPLRRWSDRPQLTHARYANKHGVPIELMVQLANTLQADAWFCIPHDADDEFVREFARLVKSQLNPKLRAFVEYSNEVWNGQFAQARYAAEQGQQLGLAKTPFESQLRYYSQRSLEIFRIWETELGRERLVRVMASQSANPWVSEQVLTWREAHRSCDALAIAPYFGHSYGNPDNAAATLAAGVDKLLDGLEHEVDTKNRETLLKQKELAARFQLPLITYEGGQHLAGFRGAENNDELTQLFIAANRHPRMETIYRKHLQHWYAISGSTFVVFSNVSRPSKWGSWGMLEYQDQPAAEAPKYRAIVEAAQTPR